MKLHFASVYIAFAMIPLAMSTDLNRNVREATADGSLAFSERKLDWWKKGKSSPKSSKDKVSKGKGSKSSKSKEGKGKGASYPAPAKGKGAPTSEPTYGKGKGKGEPTKEPTHGKHESRIKYCEDSYDVHSVLGKLIKSMIVSNPHRADARAHAR
jgi:hypothetical protein